MESAVERVGVLCLQRAMQNASSMGDIVVGHSSHAKVTMIELQHNHDVSGIPGYLLYTSS